MVVCNFVPPEDWCLSLSRGESQLSVLVEKVVKGDLGILPDLYNMTFAVSELNIQRSELLQSTRSIPAFPLNAVMQLNFYLHTIHIILFILQKLRLQPVLEKVLVATKWKVHIVDLIEWELGLLHKLYHFLSCGSNVTVREFPSESEH